VAERAGASTPRDALNFLAATALTSESCADNQSAAQGILLLTKAICGLALAWLSLDGRELELEPISFREPWVTLASWAMGT
jgi:hypothetical protein